MRHAILPLFLASCSIVVSKEPSAPPDASQHQEQLQSGCDPRLSESEFYACDSLESAPLLQSEVSPQLVAEGYRGHGAACASGSDAEFDHRFLASGEEPSSVHLRLHARIHESSGRLTFLRLQSAESSVSTDLRVSGTGRLTIVERAVGAATQDVAESADSYFPPDAWACLQIEVTEEPNDRQAVNVRVSVAGKTPLAGLVTLGRDEPLGRFRLGCIIAAGYGQRDFEFDEIAIGPSPIACAP